MESRGIVLEDAGTTSHLTAEQLAALRLEDAPIVAGPDQKPGDPVPNKPGQRPGDPVGTPPREPGKPCAAAPGQRPGDPVACQGSKR
jgi:hypothetical protein